MNKLKVTAFITGLLFAAVYATVAARAAESQLRDDVRRMVMIADGPRDQGCTQRKIVKTEVVETRSDGTPGVERWTLNRCGKLVNYRIRYTPNAQGGTDFDVQLEASSPLALSLRERARVRELRAPQ